MPPQRSLKLIAIGTLAGLFSGLFGVGGGSVIVPLLVLMLAYEERAATATSLAAIVFIAAFAAGVQGLYGNVRPFDALLQPGAGEHAEQSRAAEQQRVERAHVAVGALRGCREGGDEDDRSERGGGRGALPVGEPEHQ